jgi:hypothetical protein
MRLFIPLFVLAGGLIFSRADTASEAREFLRMYNEIGRGLITAANEAEWKASTDVKDEHTGQRIGANEVRAKFIGSPYIIEKAKALPRAQIRTGR